MKRMLTIMLALLLVLIGTACSREKDKLPDGSDKVTEFATIPSFQAVFLALDKLDPGDLAGLNQNKFSAPEQDTLRTAFAWGALVAESQLAVATRNADWLRSVLGQLQALPASSGLKGLAVQLGESVKPNLASGDWEQVKRLIYNMQSTADKSLMDSERYGDYTIIALGSWTETVNQIGRLIAANYSTEKSMVLNTTAWQDLAGNILLMDSAKFAKSGEFAQGFELVQQLQDMMNSAGQSAFTQEQVSEIVTATESIRVCFTSP